ncbi:1,4-dihydroxy-6-naphthoate synthase [Desulfoferrobacter suflitae]|uniref:1,4-dihydroxy-6-naphthoate synthase n=1 Tax=Desulfoferrobacter suflitae TaxID=2865782 RepID=UPI002164024B|nr:1,4-dihydroxy-6-naphthoate synthase [Desulfoferrobacter suflitae]MCK8600690.1 1,4-dihydroxy-6-naphthoate synthase [Desulfoferrobacter suflitae]
MTEVLSLGYSPCPNDTFIFFALSQGLIDTGRTRFEIHLADVEELNGKASKCALDVTKVSMSVLPNVQRHYLLLTAGGAMGRGCGPLVVARKKFSTQDFRKATLAVPGKMTTAFLLLQLHGGHGGTIVEMPFDQIMPAVAAGQVDAGLIIHEGRFTYPSLGLQLILDLGSWWEDKTGLPLPLGGIVMKRSFGYAAAQRVEQLIRQSIRYAHTHIDEAWPYIRSLAQEMETGVIRRHIEMFVNEFSMDFGNEGKEAIRVLLEASARQQGIDPRIDSLWGNWR